MAEDSNGGGSAYCFQWGGQYWGKDYPGWSAFKAWLIDHGANVDAWIINHPAAAVCIGAPTGEVPPPSGPPPPPATGPQPTEAPPAEKQSCFKWGGEKWGKDYPGWSAFKAWLIDHGADPDTWAANHPDAAECIGAKRSKYCFEWGGQKWGKDYPKWQAFKAWLTDHGADPDTWAANHPDAAACVGAPTPAPSPPPGPGPTPPPTPGPGPTPTPGPVPPPPYQANVGPWTGRGVYTSNDPERALDFGDALQWVAVKYGQVSEGQIGDLRGAGLKVTVWEDSATAAGVAFAINHADGYIAQAEGPDELAAAVALTASIGSMPKALVSNNFMDAYPPGWVAQPEAYTNDNAQATIDQVARDAQFRGAQAVVPIVGTFDGRRGWYSGAQYLADAAAHGIVNLGAFSAEAMNDEQFQAWSTPGPPPSAPTGGGGGEPPGTAPDGRRYCFEWGGQYWGGDYAGWDTFRQWLQDHGADPTAWAVNHPDAAKCIGVPGIGELTSPPSGGAAAGGQVVTEKITLTHLDLENLWVVAGGMQSMADIAAAIAQAESGGCRFAKAGPADDRPQKLCVYRYTTGENSYGLWQINRQAHPQYGAASLYTAIGNVNAAVAVAEQGRNFNPWTTYRTGAYKAYLQGPATIPPQPGTTVPSPGAPPAPAPSGINNAWRYVLRRFSRMAPQQRHAVDSLFKNPKELFR